jgi:hypothetical protein
MKHPGLIGSSGIALNPQVTVHAASPIEENPNYQQQPDELEQDLGFVDNDDVDFPVLDINY